MILYCLRACLYCNCTENGKREYLYEKKKIQFSYKSCFVHINSMFRLGSLHSNRICAQQKRNAMTCHATLSNAIVAALEKCVSGKMSSSRYKTFSMNCSPRVGNGPPLALRLSLHSWVLQCASDPLLPHGVRTAGD